MHIQVKFATTIPEVRGQKNLTNQLNVCRNDIEILRGLALRVVELSSRPIENEKKQLWYDHNALKQTRPVIFCDPENGWNEIITSELLECEGDLARGFEMHLRKEIFWGESMGDDRAVNAYINIEYVHEYTGWGLDANYIGRKSGNAYTWEAPLKDYNTDFSKLRFPEIIIDYKKTDELFELASEIFGDILTVRKNNSWWWTLGLTNTLVKLRGLEQMLFDMYDYPDELKRLMKFLQDGQIHTLDYLEENGLLDLNNDETYVGSGGFGFTNELPQKDFDGKNVRTMDMWGFMESQETSHISPEMFEEFILPYQVPILERFGLNCYGCCEPLEKRWYAVKHLPRLRRISVSPWADQQKMADFLGNKYIYSLKPNPAYLAVANIDMEYMRGKLREAFKITRDCRVEIIMKDNTTIGHNPQNVIDWCRIAREESENI